MKSSWRLVLPGLAAYVFFLLWLAPAAKVLPYIQPRLPDVRFAGLNGTVWSGQAAQMTIHTIPLTDVSWALRPLALLGGAVEYRLKAYLNDQPLTLRAGQGLFTSAYAADIRTRIAASELLYRAGLTQVGVAGQLQVNLDRVTNIGADHLPAVAGRITWIPAMVLAPLALNLGVAHLETHIEDGVTHGKLTTSDGVLLLNGDLTVKPDGNYQLNGELQKKGNLPQAVNRFLETFAEFKNGRYQLEWSDRI